MRFNMGLKSQQFGIWSLIIAAPILTVTFWFIAKFVPLPAPSLSAVEVATMYQQNPMGIRAMIMAWAFLWSFWLPFSTTIAAQMSRSEQGFPFWSVVQVGGGIGLMLIVILNSLCWGVASFRLDRAPEVVQAFNDLGWLLFVMPAGPLGFQLLSVGITALGDKNPQPIFPRWFGYLSVWGCMLTMTGYLIIFFKSGPFAWNGLIGFFLPLCVIGIWSTCLIILLFRGVRIQAQEQQAVLP